MSEPEYQDEWPMINDDLVMLLRRIIAKAEREKTNWRVIQQAKNYLGNKEQLGQILRQDGSSTPDINRTEVSNERS